MFTPKRSGSAQRRLVLCYSLTPALLLLATCAFPFAASANSGSFQLNDGTRGSHEQQLAKAPSLVLSEPTGAPLVTEDFESLPILSNEGDLILPGLAFDADLARSQTGMPVYVGELVDASYVPGLPRPKDPSLDNGRRYYGETNQQVASLRPSNHSSAEPERPLESKLLVKKPKRAAKSPTPSTPTIKPVARSSPLKNAAPKEKLYLEPLKKDKSVQDTMVKVSPDDKSAQPPQIIYEPGIVAENPDEKNPITNQSKSEQIPQASNEGGKKEKLVARILFPAKASTLPLAAENGLKKLAIKIKANPEVSIRLWSYAASAIGDSQGAARRLSLSRALSVRKFFVSQGIPTNRMDIRSLDSEATGKDSHRLDVFAFQGQS